MNEKKDKPVMRELPRIDSDKIHILSVKTLKGNIDAATTSAGQSVAGHTYNFDLGFGLDVKEKVMGVELTVAIEAVDSQKKPLKISGAYTHEVTFRVDNMEEFLFSEAGEKPVPHWLLASTLASIAYSTVRGIVFTRTQGTSLNTVILPVISPKELIGMEETKKQDAKPRRKKK